MGLLDLFKTKDSVKIRQFGQRLDEIESQMKLLRLEWGEAYDKVHHALDRVAKRWTRLHSENNGSAGSDPKEATEPVSVEKLWQIARQRGMVR